MFDVTKLLEEIKASPYKEIVIKSPHSGVISFESISLGTSVISEQGTWKEKPGTLLATLVRENNPKTIHATEKGELIHLATELEGQFVEAGVELAKIRHFLTRDEVLSLLLQKALYLFNAPERAKYYFAPEVDKKIKGGGVRSIHVTNGMELFIMSRMKREMALNYSGPEGLIYEVYFGHNENVDAGQPLIGVCPSEQLSLIEEVVMRVKTEWEERE